MGRATFPLTWDGPHFKTPRLAAKVRRGLKRRGLLNAETKQKIAVRIRDRGCRFPLCGCKRFGLALHVSHQTHKGAGGNPLGDRSDVARMLQVCNARHKEHAVSLDRGTLRWRSLTRQGANGPVLWEIAVDRLALGELPANRWSAWFEVARESAVQQLEPLTARQRTILQRLAHMTT